MPLWLWLIVVAIGLAVAGYRQYTDKAALRRRAQELAAQQAANRPEE